ncbi:MAG TPA: divergent polysaccharide deacetylase family protein [Candidatus Cloacimonadota bacterium]|nr:divergent polysaccharide deacetylase family protein [Candidatus Cloacimonadota bacterium]
MARKLSILFILLILLALWACKADREQVTPEGEYNQETGINGEEAIPDSQDTDSASTGRTNPNRSSSDSLSLRSNYSWSNSGEIPPVVIIVDDFGYTSGSLLDDFAALPSEIVFAVLPDLPQTQRSAALAAQHGHEVIIHVPMEALGNGTKPGERYIRDGMSAEAVKSLLTDFHEQIPMAIAANNHMGSRATADPELMNPVLDHLNSLGMFFIDSAVTANRLSYNLAKQKGHRTYRRDIFLDVPDNTDATLAGKIESLGRYKNRVEPIVVITHCHNRAKLVALQKFIGQIRAMGVRIMSLSQVRQYAGA